jgi:hypothetical protein
MRSFFKYVLTVVFILGLPLAVWLALPKFNGFTVRSLELALQQRQTYAQMSAIIQQQLNQQTPAAGDPVGQIGALVKGELTPSYVQTKLEDVLNQTSAWSLGQTQTPPSISFNDIQQKLLVKSPVSKLQIDAALSGLKTQQSHVGDKLPQVTGDAQAQQTIQQLLLSSDNLDRVANGDWTISLQQPLAALPAILKWYTIGLPVLVGLLLLDLVGAILLARGVTARLKTGAWVLLLTGLWNGILSAVFYYVFLRDTLIRFIPSSGITTDALRSFLNSLQASLFANYALTEAAVSVGLIVFGALLFVIAKIVKTPTLGPAPQLAGSVMAAPLSKPTDIIEPVAVSPTANELAPEESSPQK